jgi:hypothetical protein
LLCPKNDKATPEFEFSSNFIQLSADGSFFNEIFGSVCPDRMVLTSIANLDETRTVNINILTHLEIERLKYLVKEKKLSFAEAKEQCYKEILNIFEIDTSAVITSEKLDISKTGHENVELLAISSIILATRQTSSLTEFLTRLQIDIKEDGVLDSEALQSDLINSAVLLDCETISKNLKDRYLNLGIEISIPDVRSVVDSFINHSNYHKLVEINIPKSTELGINILGLGDTVQIDTNLNYCIALNQVCNINHLNTYMYFEEFEWAPCRENIELTKVSNWGIQNAGYPSYLEVFHPFGLNEQICFGMEKFTGNSNMKIAFMKHGSFNLRLNFDSDLGINRKVHFIYW